jgi:hypothetical protein
MQQANMKGANMHRYLVVANKTLGGPALVTAIRERAARGPCAFHIVVPASRPRDHLVWTEGEAREVARERLTMAMLWFREHQIEVSGEVGDEKPMLAIEDALIAGDFDEIILSTLPAGVSHWLRQDLPARAQRKFGIPVSHVVGREARAARTA